MSSYQNQPALSDAEISVAVRLNGELTRLANRARLSVSLRKNATIDTLFEQLSREHPALTERLQQAVPVVNGTHTTRDYVLTNGEEVALLLPIAGGKS